MNLQQLRIIKETIRCHYNLTEVGNVLYTSPSGVSKHIKDLEDELGLELFIRKGKRLLGLTEPGKELLNIVERIMLDTENIRQLAEHFSQTDQGQLTLATTHAQARYVLPHIIKQFKQAFPKVHLAIHQTSPEEIVSLLIDGQADIGIATESLDLHTELATFPYYTWHHAIIVPKGHPLENLNQVGLEDIAEYPIITYHEGFTGRKTIDEAFAKKNLIPDIILSALDADVIKTYVELELGIGIITFMAYQKDRDSQLTLLNNLNLFASNTTKIAIRKGRYLRTYVYKFLTLCSPALTEDLVRASIYAPSTFPTISAESA